MHSTISMGQVGLAFSRRQQCLFKIKSAHLKTLKYGQELKRCKFPDVIRTDRETENSLLSCMRTET